MVNFDLSKQSTINQSHCNVNGSWFRIGHPSYKEMYLQVQFKNYSKSNFLNEVHLVYTLDHMFPDAKNKGENLKKFKIFNQTVLNVCFTLEVILFCQVDPVRIVKLFIN